MRYWRLFPSVVGAAPTVYGKAYVSFRSVDDGQDSVTDIRNNASRIGIKGKEELSDSLSAIYLLEYETFVDGETRNNSRTECIDVSDAQDGSVLNCFIDDDTETFSQRNTYIGLQTVAGTFIAGRIDTPLKRSQSRLDLFNDLEGDIKNIITNNDNRENDSLHYITPSSLGPFQATVAYIASGDADVDDGTSLSLAYSTDPLYVAVAVDSDVEAEGTDVVRLVGLFRLGGFQFGGLWEDVDAEEGDDVDGWVVSARYKIDAHWYLNLQFGESDVIAEGGEGFSAGAEYRFTKTTRLFGYYTTEEANNGVDNDFVGVALEVKF